MSSILDAAVEYVASTTRWSADVARPYIRGTLWFGILSRSFLLVERLLRLCLIELSTALPELLKAASRARAQGKSLEEMTFGQLVGVLEEIADELRVLLANIYPTIKVPAKLLSNDDRNRWKIALALRNEITHEGPGFSDSVDLEAGRVWRRYASAKRQELEGGEIWEIGQHLCRSPFVLTCVKMQGIDENAAIRKLDVAGATQFTVHDISDVHREALDGLHQIVDLRRSHRDNG
jgi:hypothetical protein